MASQFERWKQIALPPPLTFFSHHSRARGGPAVSTLSTLVPQKNESETLKPSRDGAVAVARTAEACAEEPLYEIHDAAQSCEPTVSVCGLVTSRIWLIRLLRRACGNVDLDEHSRPSERSHDEKRAGRLGRTRLFEFHHARGGDGVGLGRKPRQRHQSRVRGRAAQRPCQLSAAGRESPQPAGGCRLAHTTPARGRRQVFGLSAGHGEDDG